MEKKKVYETIIIGAGMSGLACARKLHENKKEFLVISEDIGGRIQTSKDGKVNYGSVFISKNFKHVIKFAKIIKKMSYCFNVSFQMGPKNCRMIPRVLFTYPLKYLNVLFRLSKFKRRYEAFKKKCETISQAEALRSDSYLFELYNKNAMDYIREHKMEDIAKDYEGMCRSCNFLPFNKINAFTFLWGCSSLCRNGFYKVLFLIEKMIKNFKKNIKIDSVSKITKKKDYYILKTKRKIFYAKNVVVATPPHISKKLLNLKEIKKPINAYVIHLSGRLRKPWSKYEYTVFSGKEVILGILRQENGTTIIYSKEKNLNFKKYFHEYKIINSKFWNPAYNMIGNVLWECKQDKNLYLIGDHNIFFLEDAYITGIYAANQIIKGG